MKEDLICFSHLRWDFVYQRPQHLMSRAAKHARVFYFEEPLYSNEKDQLRIFIDPVNLVTVVTPVLDQNDQSPDLENQGSKFSDNRNRMIQLVDRFLLQFNVTEYLVWYYAPMALAYTEHLKPKAIIYDCMDELSAFNFAPADLVKQEKRLFSKANLVFTGGHRLFESKKALHNNIHAFPSAIDKEFFYPARKTLAEPLDQGDIPRPRLGFFGVIDERFDTGLVGKMADSKPDWQFIFIGPVVKIEASALPRNENIHYLGMKHYKELPDYISGWDLCIMPFAINASTEFISPTKTPEFLAAGKRVISTPIHDVVHPYGDHELVGIADCAEGFIEIAELDLLDRNREVWLERVDAYLANISWDKTWDQMSVLIEDVLNEQEIAVTR